MSDTTTTRSRALDEAFGQCTAGAVIDRNKAVDLLLDIRLAEPVNAPAVDAALVAVGTRSMVPTDELVGLLESIESHSAQDAPVAPTGA